ncbi:prepilin-type N-terminal cleavage/methylation domain-containing protein [Nitrospirota bacterium]
MEGCDLQCHARYYKDEDMRTRGNTWRNRGFSIVELMIVLGISLFVLTAASKVMVAMITQFKQQSKIVETNIESVVGLELLRRDLQALGHGLGGGFPVSSTDYSCTNWDVLKDYKEAKSVSKAGPDYPDDPADYNDAPKYPPRPIASGNNTMTNDSDYLVIKSVNLGTTDAAGKIHTLTRLNEKNQWNPVSSGLNLNDKDRVIVISLSDNKNLGLVTTPRPTDLITQCTDYGSGSLDWHTKFDLTAAYVPPNKEEEAHLVYGVESETTDNPRAPFNRADYYILRHEVPTRCAPGTGVLVKVVMLHSDGSMSSPLPLLDCVADFQVSYGVDTNGDGEMDQTTDGPPPAGETAAKQIRDQGKVVYISILTHEGQFDRGFTYATQKIDVDDFKTDFDLATLDSVNWSHYRWRVLKLAVIPTLLR